MRKILSLFLIVFLFFTSLVPNANAVEFTGCSVTTDPPTVTDKMRMIKNITVDTKDTNGNKRITSTPNVWVWFSNDGTKGYPMAKFGGLAGDNFLLSNGVVSVNNVNSGGRINAGEVDWFKAGTISLTVTEPKTGGIEFCKATFTVHPGSVGQCAAVPGNAPGQLTPSDQIIVKAPDIASYVSDPNKKLKVFISSDVNGQNRIGNADQCPTMSELKQGFNMGFTLNESKNNYYIHIKNGCGFGETGLCYGSFLINTSGGLSPEQKCEVCPPGTKLQGGACISFPDPDLSPPKPPTTITCYDPFRCPTDGSSICQITDVSRFQNSFNAGTPYSFNPCPGISDTSGNCKSVRSGLGITFETSAQGIGKGLLGILITIGGAVAFIIIIITGYRLMTSGGDPEKIKAAREQLTSAIVGLLFIIFSIAILSFLGFDVLHIPGIGK